MSKPIRQKCVTNLPAGGRGPRAAEDKGNAFAQLGYGNIASFQALLSKFFPHYGDSNLFLGDQWSEFRPLLVDFFYMAFHYFLSGVNGLLGRLLSLLADRFF